MSSILCRTLTLLVSRDYWNDYRYWIIIGLAISFLESSMTDFPFKRNPSFPLLIDCENPVLPEDLGVSKTNGRSDEAGRTLGQRPRLYFYRSFEIEILVLELGRSQHFTHQPECVLKLKPPPWQSSKVMVKNWRNTYSILIFLSISDAE